MCEKQNETGMIGKKAPNIEVEVRSHPSSCPEYLRWLAIVTTARGLSYFCTFAGDKPTEEKIKQEWQKARKAFDPYFS